MPAFWASLLVSVGDLRYGDSLPCCRIFAIRFPTRRPGTSRNTRSVVVCDSVLETRSQGVEAADFL